MSRNDKSRPTLEQNKNISAISVQPACPFAAAAEAVVPTKRLLRIRELNDELRRSGRGGVVLVTDGIAAMGSVARAILDAVEGFDEFDAGNDPWGEHDCGSVEIRGRQIIWKIDYYDRSRQFHSPDPADPKVTTRVLTIMLASEY